MHWLCFKAKQGPHYHGPCIFLLRRGVGLSRMEVRRPDRLAALPLLPFRQEILWLSRGIKKRTNGGIYQNHRVTAEAVCWRPPAFKKATCSLEPEPFFGFCHKRPERSSSNQLDGGPHFGSEYEWTGPRSSADHAGGTSSGRREPRSQLETPVARWAC